MVPNTDAEWGPKLTQNGPTPWPETGPKLGPKRGPKWTKMEPRINPKWSPKWAQHGARNLPWKTPRGRQQILGPPGGGPDEGVRKSGGLRTPPLLRMFTNVCGVFSRGPRRPQIDVHGPDSGRPFGAVRLSELRIAFVNGSVCSERTKTRYFITRRPLSASANAKNERIPGLRDLALFWPVSG